MSQYYNSNDNSAFNSPKPKAKEKKAGQCRRCGKTHEAGCFDIGAAVRRQFIKEFHKFMED